MYQTTKRQRYCRVSSPQSRIIIHAWSPLSAVKSILKYLYAGYYHMERISDYGKIVFKLVINEPHVLPLSEVMMSCNGF